MKLNVKQVGIGDLGMRYPMTLNILYGLERCYTPSVDGNEGGSVQYDTKTWEAV